MADTTPTDGQTTPEVEDAPVAVPRRRKRDRFRGWFANRRMNTKIQMVVLLVTLVSIGVVVLSVVKLATVNASVHKLERDNVVPITELAAMQKQAQQSWIDMSNLAEATSASSRQDWLNRIHEQDTVLDTAMTAYMAHAARKDLVTKFQSVWSDYRLTRDSTAIPMVIAGDRAKYAQVREDKLAPATEQAFGLIDQMTTVEQSDAQLTVTRSDSTFRNAVTFIIGWLLIGVALAVALALFLAHLVTSPLRRVSRVLRAVAEGDLTQTARVDSHCEVGEMAQDLNTAVASLRQAIATMAASAGSLAISSEELSATSQQIAASAEETSAQANVVAAASEQVSRNVQTVAAGSMEMGASIHEIAQNATEAARVAQSAVVHAAETNAQVGKLGESSQEIGNVIKVITQIAEQTNLLALNATIEAARAGDAGRGFVVVANEVKELARETARATDDIAHRVQTIQGDTAVAVRAIGEIGDIIGRISDFQTTIASAVEEQTATTNEMNRNVNEAATGSTEIATNISGVATAAETTTAGVAQTQQAAAELAHLSSELHTLVARFRY